MNVGVGPIYKLYGTRAVNSYSSGAALVSASLSHFPPFSKLQKVITAHREHC